MASLSALPALLASPAFHATGLSSLAAVLHSTGRGAAACDTLAAADTGCDANHSGGPGPGAGLPALHLCEVELAGLPSIALRRAWKDSLVTCQGRSQGRVPLAPDMPSDLRCPRCQHAASLSVLTVANKLLAC